MFASKKKKTTVGSTVSADQKRRRWPSTGCLRQRAIRSRIELPSGEPKGPPPDVLPERVEATGGESIEQFCLATTTKLR